MNKELIIAYRRGIEDGYAAVGVFVQRIAVREEHFGAVTDEVVLSGQGELLGTDFVPEAITV